jgi:hypothetical protein
MGISNRTFPGIAAVLFLASSAHAQRQAPIVQDWLLEHYTQLGLTAQDAAQWAVTSASSDRNGTRYVYIRQQVNGLPVQGAVANFALRNGHVVSFGNRLIKDVSAHAPSVTPGIGAGEALKQAANQLGLSVAAVRVTKTVDETTFELSPSDIASGPIKAQLVYQPVAGEGLKLAWRLSIRSSSSVHWWDLAVDAGTGKILRLNDRNVACRLPNGSFANARCPMEAPPEAPMEDGPPPPDGASYRVFALPVQSPSFGPRTLLSDPADGDASPYGWHDINGMQGAEYTITRGNNVYASDDIDNDDLPGFSPGGGADLSFDYPFTMPAAPPDNLDAAIVNLFYMCNTLHDIWYQYGFDEESGNFQSMNYTGAGLGGDEVLADAQDGGGINNANFATPDDGESGRMQMYTWSSEGVDSSLVVNSPASVDGPYVNVIADFGPPLPTVPITADVVLVQDDAAPASDGCDNITNGADLMGKIALVDRGICTFVSKVQALQDAGAVAVIVINNQGGGPFAMSGNTGNIAIPAVMISQGNGIGFKNALTSGPVNATLQGHNALFDKDGDFDNGVIAHEYGHGVSTRLTGGPADSGCLWNDEQMGEGWSDWMALLLTMEPGDHGTDARGIGTYVVDEPTTGPGLRPAPYSTDLSVNQYTYGDLNNQNLIFESHDIGFLWATMGWDMTWALVNAHGLDPDMYHGNGGNNIAMKLMMDGLKLQPCSPGFVDGRNAILQADSIDFGGADACLIWNAFARRGLGYSADQGSSFSRFDQTEAFDLPPGCGNILSVGESLDRNADFVSLVPNPAQELVTIGLRAPLKEDLKVTVYTAEGRSVLAGEIKAGSTMLKLDIASLAPGSYQVDLRGAGSAWHRSLIVVR